MAATGDEQLLQELNAESTATFSDIYKKYWQKTYMQAYDRLKDAKQSQDITQDIFIGLWEKWDTLAINNLPAYLSACVKYSVFKLVAADQVKADYFSLAEELHPTASAADHHLITAELVTAFNNLIEEMPPQRKRIFQMRYDDNLKTKDIASQLNISQKTVQNQLLSSYRDVKTLLAQILSSVLFLVLSLPQIC